MTEQSPSPASHHLAQLNLARALGPPEDPSADAVMREFMDNLDHVNSLADRSPGFVWRLQTDDGNATSIRAFDEPDLLLNLSVWEDFESFHHYVYKTDHADFLRRRKEWFKPVEGLPVTVLWWIPAGMLPTVDEAIGRLRHLAEDGPTSEAFNFRVRFEPPGEAKAESGPAM
ncbi:MAG: DUF3291 domain-containing protein [Acidimicrobiia bacterium]|nr:DUF3291 domain-containing protein [Acidimicrobiia bacterium]